MSMAAILCVRVHVLMGGVERQGAKETQVQLFLGASYVSDMYTHSHVVKSKHTFDCANIKSALRAIFIRHCRL